MCLKIYASYFQIEVKLYSNIFKIWHLSVILVSLMLWIINRNILVVQSEHERQESWEAIGARLIRRLSMRPTAEELVERNILKSKHK